MEIKPELGGQKRINLQSKKFKQKGTGEQRENRLKWLTRNLKDLPVENGETKSKERPASNEAEETRSQV